MSLRVIIDSGQFVDKTKGSSDILRRIIAETDAETSQVLASNTRMRAPVKTGFLRSSVEALSEGVRVGAGYAGIVESRRPFLTPAVAETTPFMLRRLVEKLEEAFKDG